MDPLLWSTLPSELMEVVFATFSIAKVIDLCALDSAWSSISKSPNFRRVFFERHPKLFGLLGWHEVEEKLYNLVFDVISNEWVYRELAGFRKACATRVNNYVYQPLTASDGGLVCFVPQRIKLGVPIVVGNPLTDEWNALPCIPFGDKKRDKKARWNSLMVQLVVEDDTKWYRVMMILFYCARMKYRYAAHCFDSRTGAWSTMESGLVCGGHGSSGNCGVFDCTTKTMISLENCHELGPPSFEDAYGSLNAVVKDRLFVLHRCWPNHDFTVSEFVLRSTKLYIVLMTRIMTSNKQLIDINEGYHVHFFACSGFALLFADRLCEDGMNRHQVLRLFDSSTQDWPDVSVGDDIRFTLEQLQGACMCELRWDAVP